MPTITFPHCELIHVQVRELNDIIAKYQDLVKLLGVSASSEAAAQLGYIAWQLERELTYIPLNAVSPGLIWHQQARLHGLLLQIEKFLDSKLIN